MKNLFFCLLALVFFGCASTKNMDEPQKKELLAYTQKFEAQNFLVVASYINPIYAQEKGEDGMDKNDDFIVSLYPKEAGILIHTIEVNGSSDEISVHLLNDDEPLLDKLAFRTPWAKYYKISVPAKDGSVLNLSFSAGGENSQTHQVSLNFQKIARSLYWSPR